MMRLPVPLLQRFHQMLWGAALGGSWGAIHDPAYSPFTENFPESGIPLRAFQQFTKVVADDTASAVLDPRNQIFLQFAQLIQACVQTQCQRGQPPLSPANSPRQPAALATQFAPWVTALIATLLNGQGANTALLDSLTTRISPLLELPTNRVAEDPNHYPTLTDLMAFSLLWKTMLLSAPATGVAAPSALPTVLTDWREMSANHDIATEWMLLLLPLEAEYQQQRPLHFVASQLQQQHLTTQSTAIAIAWYAFRTTPHDLALSLTRVVAHSPDPALSGLLTGLWSNLYNGEVGLTPTSGQAKMTLRPLGIPPATARSTQFLAKAATQLFATWSGILYSPSVLDEASLLQITAPRRLHHL